MRRHLSLAAGTLCLGIALALASCAGDPRPGSPEAARARRALDFDEGGIGAVSGTQGPRPFAPEVALPVGVR